MFSAMEKVAKWPLTAVLIEWMAFTMKGVEVSKFLPKDAPYVVELISNSDKIIYAALADFNSNLNVGGASPGGNHPNDQGNLLHKNMDKDLQLDLRIVANHVDDIVSSSRAHSIHSESKSPMDGNFSASTENILHQNNALCLEDVVVPNFVASSSLQDKNATPVASDNSVSTPLMNNNILKQITNSNFSPVSNIRN